MKKHSISTSASYSVIFVISHFHDISMISLKIAIEKFSIEEYWIFSGFPRLGLIIFPKFTWNTFFIQNHFWHIFFQIYVWLSSYLEYFCWILFLNQSWYLLYFFWILFKNSHMEEDLIVSFCPTGRGLSIFPHFSWKRYYYMT